MHVPRYNLPRYPWFNITEQRQIHVMKVVSFLKWVVNRDKLEIAHYFEVMGHEPFFLVAATGLGKTVGVPIHVLIRQIEQLGSQPDPMPRVWIVEPRIPIATGQEQFMNSLWKKYIATERNGSVPPLFGCITSQGNINPEAPIKFVTTGIFELMAKSGELSPDRDRVVIDEAHVTVEQNPGVELGIALARKAGVTIDYMSATVDTTNLSESLGVANIIRADRQRFTVWKHNLSGSVKDCLTDVVKHTLIMPKTDSEYFPASSDTPEAGRICKATTESGRSHGMLVVVNSFAGEFSDTQRLARQLQTAFPNLPVLQLASEVIRDPKRMREYESRLQQIEQGRQNYVVIATSVVEMGITIPTLDFVVTMDCGYDQETVGDTTFPVVAPLGVNSLLQRIGRVGRKRPGIAYIANEIGADYSELDDETLNSRKGLAYEPIKFPLATSPLMSLAYYARQQHWLSIDTEIAALNLPSRLHENPERMNSLREQLNQLEALGLTRGNQLTPLGKQMEKWVGMTDLAYAVQLQKSLMEGKPIAEIVFWLVLTALSNTPIVTLRAKYDYFVDYAGTHGELPHPINFWNHKLPHEDAIVFDAVAQVADIMPDVVFSHKAIHHEMYDTFEDWCDSVGLNARKLTNAFQVIQDTWKLFERANNNTSFETIFSSLPPFEAFPWHTLANDIAKQQLWQSLECMSGTVSVRVTEGENGYSWTDSEGRSGLVSQDDTPIRLDPATTYVARPVPSRESKEANTTWRLAHLGIKTAEAPKVQARQDSRVAAAVREARRKVAEEELREKPKKSLFKRLFNN
jgi:hypothetical protein